MIRVVIDTNVLISGTFWDSPSFKVLDLVDTNKVSLIVSREILDEYDDVLHRDEILDKSAYSFERAQSTIKMLGNSVIVEPLEKLKLVKDDPDDDICQSEGAPPVIALRRSTPGGMLAR